MNLFKTLLLDNFKIHLIGRSFSKTRSKMKYLNQEEAINVDVELFNSYKYSIDQLMELAGLSCAHAVVKCYPLENINSNQILVCCGPGNNGGDALVAARHLSLMNYKPQIYYPVRTNKCLYKNLVHQCAEMEIEFIDRCPEIDEVNKNYSLIIDGLFGFSFKPPVRDIFWPIVDILMMTSVPIASIDVPSGWDVENGPSEESIKPDLLISLTAPKLCAHFYTGKYHYLGGRFVPPSLQKKYNLELPEYPGTDCCVKI